MDVLSLASSLNNLAAKVQNIQDFVVHTPMSEPRIPIPEFFSGDRSSFLNFRNNCKLFLSLKSRSSGDPAQQVKIVISFLRGDPQNWAFALAPGDPALLNVDAFFLALGLLYEEPNLEIQAEKALLALSQGQDEAEIYCQKFRKWSVLTQWNECALAARFRHGLSEAIKDVMSKFILSVTLICSLSSISVDAYVDSGAARSLMDWSFANRCGFSLEPLEVPIPLKGIDSTPLAMNKPQYWTQVTMRMTPVHQELIRFLSFMHDIFREYLDKFMIVYLDDVLVFSDDWESHVQQNVVRLHGIPENIVSDRGSQFVSRFWRTFCAKMGIDLSFSSAFHPQTNGQTERTNQTLETYLRCFVSADQDDWVTFLPLAEFALNNRASSATLVSPFFCNSGFHPRFSSGQVEPSDCPGVDMVVDRLHQIWSHVVDNLKLSQERAQQFANRRRRVGPRLLVGDLVWLSSRFVPMKVSSPKFKPRFIGPYRILEILNPVSFRLDLPASFAIHNVFHRSLLRKYEVPVVPSLEPPAPVLVEGELDSDQRWHSGIQIAAACQTRDRYPGRCNVTDRCRSHCKVAVCEAVMQSLARKNEWPLDKMHLTVDVMKKYKEEFSQPAREGAYIYGLHLEGAQWDVQGGHIVEARLKAPNPMMPVIFVKAIPNDKQDTRNMYECPVYKTKQTTTATIQSLQEL
ncbi:unnamed protein product [Ranitomeya imitator]|uniref:Integrase catalytic domain-containing protein n=1 Tax=Ranitomeya imitator TaxID=111125 RepID=A0ABN9MR34_9NEOB|nr:unnamed protein product [Ranitomeya imitator]